MKVTIKEVRNDLQIRQFVHFPNVLYKDNPYYVPKMERLIRSELNPKRNPAFAFCDCSCWLAFDESGRIVGRIAGIINRSDNEQNGQACARFGFLDFIDDEEVVDALFDTVEEWARQNGMKAMTGPQEFQDFDAIGLLVEGFDEVPTAYTNYHAPYYEKHLIRRGYEKDKDYVQYNVVLPDNIKEMYAHDANVIAQRYHLHHADISSRKRMNAYFRQCAKVLNETYGNVPGFNGITQRQAEALFRRFNPRLNLDFVSIVLNEKEEVVAFGFAMPSLSKVLKRMKGKMSVWGYLHFRRALLRNDRLDLLMVGVAKEYQGKGVTHMLFEKVASSILRYEIKYLETTLEQEEYDQFKPMWSRFVYRLNRRMRCYRMTL